MNTKFKKILLVLTILALIAFIGLRHDHSVKGMALYETDHFAIYHHGLKETTLIDMTNTLEHNYIVSNQFFHSQSKAKSKVIVYKDIDTFQRKCYGLFISWILPEWGAGASSKADVLMTSPEYANADHTYEDMLEIASHEYVHTLVWKIKAFADIWLDEGMAVYFSGQKQAINAPVPTFKEMQSQQINAFVDANGYLFSYYYIEYLLATYEDEQIIKLIKTDDYDACFGISKKDVYENWIDWLSEYPS